MTSNSSLAYPAEYYYPEFIDSRPDDPRTTPASHLPLTTSIENGIGSTTKVPTNLEHSNGTIIKKKPINKKPTSTSFALDVVTDQGLPDLDITQSVKTDPKKSLLRNPAEKNIPRLFVDDNVIKQAVRTPRIITTNLDDNFEQTTNTNQISNEKNSLVNGDLTDKTKFHPNGYINGNLTDTTQFYTNTYVNGDLTNKTKQQSVRFVEDEQPIDDYWKKEVYIDDEGVVSIEPLKYDKNKYDGPFGLARQGTYIFYIGLGIFTVLAAVFLIMTGIFYGKSYPDSSTNTAKLAGAGICAFAFYLGLQLILIGLWHQKYRQENPKLPIKKTTIQNESSSHLQSSMQNNQPYDYSYQQQIDYGPYGDYSNPPYASNTNEQMLLQQPGAATGAGYYDPVVWPSNVEVEAQPNSQFYQPMEWAYGPQAFDETPLTAPVTTVPVTTNNTKPEKKKHRHHKKKTVEAVPPKAKPDNLFPNSTVTEAPLPVLSKAPETNELLKTIAEMEKNAPHTSTNGTSTTKNHNRVQPVDGGTDISSLTGHRHHKSDRHHNRHHSNRHHHHERRHHRRHSYSSCSTCSDRSYDEFHSDINFDRHHYQHQHSDPVEKIITPRPRRARTPSPPRTNRSNYRDGGMGTGRQTKTMRDSGVGADLEDVPNVRDDRLEQIPVVRRTIIVEPYPAQPSSEINIKPRTNMTGKTHFGRNEQINEDNEKILYPSTSFTNKKSKKKKKTTENKAHMIEDLTLEDINDDDNDDHHHDNNEHLTTKSKKKTTNKTSSKKTVQNAFYN